MCRGETIRLGYTPAFEGNRAIAALFFFGEHRPLACNSRQLTHECSTINATAIQHRSRQPAETNKLAARAPQKIAAATSRNRHK